MRLDYPMKKNGMYLLKKTDFEGIDFTVVEKYKAFYVEKMDII